jgi:hypothetical protein
MPAAGRFATGVRGGVGVLAAALLAVPAGADEVQVSPFGGVQFGGSFDSPVYGVPFELDESATLGVTVDVPIDPRWRVEFLFSRQSTELQARGQGRPRLPQVVERYMAGIVEEPERDGPLKFFGVGLLGATRLAPGLAGADSDWRFALGLSLGLKVLPTPRLGFRFEARGFCTIVEAGSAFYCTGGTCLFRFSGSGIWQGDITAGLVLRL